MGLWALEQRNPELASQYFTYADTYDHKDARFYNAIALSEAGLSREALVAWDTVARSDREELQVVAEQMKGILLLQPLQAASLGDAQKYQYCRYRLGRRDSAAFDRLIQSMENDNYKAQALLDRSEKYFEADQLTSAGRYFGRIEGLTISDQRLYDEIRHVELRMLAYRGEVATLKKRLSGDIRFPASQRLERLLYTAIIAESEGDTLNTRRNFEILGTYNPYLEEAVMAAANYFRSQPDAGLKPYSILAEAIQVNANSIRLLKAYVQEANRQGFDEYAASAYERLQDLLIH
jgi:hypothetical protein